MNMRKTEVMKTSREGENIIKEIGGERLKDANICKYLGVGVNNRGMMEGVIEEGIVSYSRRVGQLNPPDEE